MYKESDGGDSMRQCHGHLPLAGRIMVLCSNISSIALAGQQETVTVDQLSPSLIFSVNQDKVEEQLSPNNHELTVT